MSVRIRGIYATALTHLFENVVQASPPIRERFETSFPVEHADVTVTTTADRQGVGVVGDGAGVETIIGQLREVGRDTLAWEATLPREAVYAGEVTDTLGSGAVVDVGDGEGFLPYSKTANRIEDGDRLRVQVRDASPPWSDDRPLLDTTLRVRGSLATLVRGQSRTTKGPALADLIPTDPPEGWGVTWDSASEDADLDALEAVLSGLDERASALDEAIDDGPDNGESTAALGEAVPDPAEAAPHCYWEGAATQWVWFGRESRFELDAIRREVTETMAGHHRVKAGTDGASAAVDFVEAVCGGDSVESEQDFPFQTVTGQFGPREGHRVRLDHGKPDGRRLVLGRGEVTAREADGTVTVRREMSGGGSYDALGVDRVAGDEAITKFVEGRWWYPTVYRGEDGTKRGTYVNVCTPVEVFPDAVRYVDLHVDVVEDADGRVERVDDDELDEAVEAGHVPETLAAKARDVAGAVESALRN